jgi:hypothetical protein
MARHRRYHGLDIVPGLSGITSGFKGSVRGTDVLYGVAAALATHFGVKWAMAKLAASGTTMPDFVVRFSPVISGLLVGVLVGVAGPKIKIVREHGKGIVLGALVTGGAIVALQELKTQFPVLADLSDVRLAGIILEDPALQGLLMSDRGAMPALQGAPGYVQTNFADLAAAGSDEQEELSY